MSDESRRDPADQQDDQQTKEQVMTDQTMPIVDDDGLAGAPSTTGATGAADPAGAEGPAGPAAAVGAPMSDPTLETSPAQTAASERSASASSPSESPASEIPARPAERRGPSVPTIVWGLLFGLVAAVVIVGQTSEVDLNLEVSAPLALLAAGVVLVVWGVAGLGPSRRTP